MAEESTVRCPISGSACDEGCAWLVKATDVSWEHIGPRKSELMCAVVAIAAKEKGKYLIQAVNRMEDEQWQKA